MIFESTPLEGVVVVRLEPVRDERGFFARTFCQDEFTGAGLRPCLAQCGVSFNPRRGTLRGLHLQTAPYQEAKLVRCTAGAIHDVVVDLRRGSPSFAAWWAIELTPACGRLLYIPEGVAHGFQTLRSDTEVSYQISRAHAPESAAGVRWDDPAFGIVWPLEVSVMSSTDRTRPDFAAA